MTPTEIEQRRRQLAVECDDIDAQLDWLSEMRTIPWEESPADMGGRLLESLDSLEYELGCLDFIERVGELPAGCSKRSPAAEWVWSTRPGRSA